MCIFYKLKARLSSLGKKITSFIVVLNQTCNIFKVCLYKSIPCLVSQCYILRAVKNPLISIKFNWS